MTKKLGKSLNSWEINLSEDAHADRPTGPAWGCAPTDKLTDWQTVASQRRQVNKPTYTRTYRPTYGETRRRCRVADRERGSSAPLSSKAAGRGSDCNCKREDGTLQSPSSILSFFSSASGSGRATSPSISTRGSLRSSRGPLFGGRRLWVVSSRCRRK